MLKAGYMEDWRYHKTYSGAPQGGVASPILTNILLNELDTFVETKLFLDYNRGTVKTVNPEYKRINDSVCYARKQGNPARAKELAQKTASDSEQAHA